MKLEIDLNKVLEVGINLAKHMAEINEAKEVVRDGKHRRRMENRKLRQELKLKRLEMKQQRRNTK